MFLHWAVWILVLLLKCEAQNVTGSEFEDFDEPTEPKDLLHLAGKTLNSERMTNFNFYSINKREKNGPNSHRSSVNIVAMTWHHAPGRKRGVC